MRDQVRFDTNRPHAGATAAMRNAKRLVQVQVADIATHIAGPGKPHHRVHIGPIDIDLTAMIVGDACHLGHCFFEHAMGRRIGNHTTGKVFAVLFSLLAEVLQIDIPVGGGFDHDNLPTDHIGAGGVSAMRRHRDQTDVAVPLPVGAVIGSNRQQPRIFPLRARIGLH